MSFTRYPQDRASIVTTAVLQIVRRALLAQLDGHGDMTAARDEVEALLRSEFADTAHTTLNEIRREDP